MVGSSVCRRRGPVPADDPRIHGWAGHLI